MSRLLAIDDNTDLRAAVTEYLLSLGYEVHQAAERDNYGSAQSYSSPTKDTRLERGRRRVFRVPVLVWGMNASGSPFLQQVHTIDVGLSGASIEGLAHPLVAGEVLGLEYRGCKARFRVVWAGQNGMPDAGTVELSPLDRTQDFWGLHANVATEQRTPAERRATLRCACKGSVSIRQPHTRFSQGAAVNDISLNGCYIELTTTLPVGTKVDLLLRAVDTTVHCTAEVRTSHPGVGIGVKFEEMSETDRAALERLVAHLSAAS